MAINLTKAYLDMARMIHTSPDGEASDTQVVVRARADEQGTAVFEAFFPMMAAEVIFSYSALVAFASSQLRSQWEQLQQEFPGY